MGFSLLSLLLCLTVRLAIVVSGCAETAVFGPGWFGPGCLYKCRCERNSCNSDGQCTGISKCLQGWFGPACQFEDLTFIGTVNTSSEAPLATQNRINDGDDETCYTSATSVSVTWPAHYYFTWLRVIVNESVGDNSAATLMSKFKVEFENVKDRVKTQFRLPRIAKVNSRTLDLHFDLDVAVNKVVLSGDGIKHLCTLHISGGHNIALRQRTAQSSPFGDYRHEHAVDGVRGTSTDMESCTHTGETTSTPNFTLRFSKPQRVIRYVLYNRIAVLRRLRGFVLKAFDTNLTQVFHFKDAFENPQRAYTVTPFPVKDVSYLVISLPNKTDDHRYLTLCELEVYTEPQCTTGRYGLGCNATCNCHGNKEDCFSSTGGCPSGCASGYTGEDCSEDCQPGTFGVDCKNTCSRLCLNESCVRTNGFCDKGCVEGYIPPQCIHSDAYQSEGESSPAATFGVIFGVLVLVLVAVTVSVFLWRKRRLDSGGPAMSKDTGGSQELEFIALAPTECAGSGIHKEDKTYESIGNKQEGGTTAIRVEDLESFMLSTDAEYFKSQFQKIPNISQDATMNAALSPRNKNKNRYKNICVYDHSRVTLTVNEDKNEEDYINASFIEGYKNEEKFIATQAPTKVMINDFIRMLWEYKVVKVVMLTNLTEEGKLKCEKYWPEDSSIGFGDIEVHLATTHVFADYTIRKLRLKKDGQPPHSLTQFHFTSWPDKGVPETPWPLVDFEQRVTSFPSDSPVVVHCSAGVGRTGTFIALCNVIREAKDMGQIDFYRTLAKLRTERVQMIQTYEQYIFLHKAAQMAMVCLGTTVSAEDVADRIADLELTSKNGQTYMEAEFYGICSLTFDNTDAPEKEESLSVVYGNISNSTEKQKNRFSNIVPKDIHRPFLHCETRGFSNYINAVLVPSFTKLNSQILTQLPLPTTINDFWRLVMQHRVSLIVAFESDAMGIDSSIGEYLPNSQEKSIDALFDIKAGPTTHGSLWAKQDLVIAPSFKKKSFKRTTQPQNLNVTHLKITSTALEPEILLALATQIRSCRSGDADKILYMCRNGAEFSGLAYVTTLLLDRMDNDCCLTVPPVVGAIKLVRPQVIPNLEQYRALYTVLKLYTESSSTYSNFGKPTIKPASEPSKSLNSCTRNEDFSVYSN